MLTATGGLLSIRPHYTGEQRDLMRVLLSAVSVTEANLALEVLSASVPEKTLVSACNLREVFRALPASPFPMRVDETTLCRTAGLERNIAVFGKRLPDDCGLFVATAGNLVLDIIIKYGGKKLFWSPVPVEHDFVSPEVVDLAIESDYLLDAVIGLAHSMGLVFNPRFYLSLEDWHMDNASSMFNDLGDLF